MGARGPKALPANVHLLRGNPSKKSFDSLLGELQPEVDMPSAPSDLWAEAKAEWRRMKPHLLKNGLVSQLDRAALATHCQSWAEWRHHLKEMTRDMRAAEKARTDAEAAGMEYTGGDGIMVKTSNGNFTYSHHWVCKNKALAQLEKSYALFGMSPSHRSSVTVSNNRQAGLFEEGTQDEWNSL